MRKLVATGLLAASITGGSLAVAAVDPFGIADAQEGATETAPTERTRPAAVLDEVLAGLVADGTLTQGQADTVRQRIHDAVAEHRGGDGDHGRPRIPFGQLKKALEPVAETLGMSPAELGQALRSGSTLNELAAANGVDQNTLRQQIIDIATTHIDEAVASGKLDAERAARWKEALPGRVDTFMAEGMRRPGA